MPCTLLIAGCGDLGIRLAARLADWRVAGVRRNPATLAGTAIEPIAADLSQPAGLGHLPAEVDHLVYTATPARRDESAYRACYVQGLRNLLARVHCRRLIFVSSTAVYGQDSGEWVDERSPTRPAAFNGRVLLEAEDIARRAGGMVVRFSGIYGPGREALLDALRAGGVRCRRTPPQWTNRIHAEDCAGALAHLLQLDRPETLYCASDALPAPRFEVLEWLAGRLGVDGPVEDPAASRAGQGRRVSAKRLVESGFALQYPDYRAGYGALIGGDCP